MAVRHGTLQGTETNTFVPMPSFFPILNVEEFALYVSTQITSLQHLTDGAFFYGFWSTHIVQLETGNFTIASIWSQFFI